MIGISLINSNNLSKIASKRRNKHLSSLGYLINVVDTGEEAAEGGLLIVTIAEAGEITSKMGVVDKVKKLLF